jgi:hypothetical protein
MVVCTCHPSDCGKVKQEDEGLASPGQKLDPVSKITRAKRAGKVAQVVECPPNKYEALMVRGRSHILGPGKIS